MMDQVLVTPVVLAGGAGTRLWPLSRELCPKQLLPLAGEQPMLAATLARFTDTSRFAPPLVLTNEALRFSVADQLLAFGQGKVILEPMARNTAPAVAAAALVAGAADPEAVLLVVASDHVIGDVPAFLAAVQAALPAARKGRLVTFSIKPSRPETGFGYIRRGPPLAGDAQVFEVAAFVEKPDAERAAAFVATGDHAWNSGMFLFSAKSFLAELAKFAPAVLAAAQAAVADAKDDHDFLRLNGDAFAKAPSISIDYAVMEKTALAATIPCDIGWTDVGSWAELWLIGDKDSSGNVVVGDGFVLDSRNSYVRTDGPMVSVLGVDDLVVVATEDAVMVMPKGRAQDVRLIADYLRDAKRDELVSHRFVSRPWGSFTSVRSGERFQVKQLTVKPGAKLSLQKHYHRAEHWVVVNGTALITRGDDTHILRENESVYIPSGVVHQLENPGKVPLNIIEVQSGSYLGEDDIVRLDDPYGRVEPVGKG